MEHWCQICQIFYLVTLNGKMVFSTEHKIKIIECYFRTGLNVNVEWQYSIPECMADFHKEYTKVVFDYNAMH